MRVVLAYVFLVGLLLLVAAAGYGLWACADAAAHAAWYCRVLEGIKPFTELISVILAFFGFLFGTIFSKNLAHEKETRALARAFAAEVLVINIFLQQRINEYRLAVKREGESSYVSPSFSFIISETPVYNRSAHSIGQFPVLITTKINIFYWLLKYSEHSVSALLTKEKDKERPDFNKFPPAPPYSWTKLQQKAAELEPLLSDFANTPLPPWWKLMWLR